MAEKLFSDELILTPKLRPLIVNGSIYYNDKDGYYNLLRLKKQILNEFMELNNKNVSPAYRMEIYRSGEQLLRRIEKLENEKRLPILLFFYTEI